MKDYFKQSSFLAQVNQGNEQAFLEVYDFYVSKLLRHISYRLSSREAAEDITQQVFYKTWQYLMKGDKIDNINAFLYRIANNLLADYYRKSERNNISLDDDLDSNLERKIATDPSYSNSIDHDLATDHVKEALKQLKEFYRQLIIWRYFDDLSILEIAKISGKPANSVYVGLHRAMKELKKLLV